MSLLILESLWQMHSNEYQHAWYRFNNSWNKLSHLRIFEREKMVKKKNQNYPNFKMSLLILESLWQMHSNEYQHAWYRFNNSWNKLSHLRIFEREKMVKKKNQNYPNFKMSLLILESLWQMHSNEYQHAWYRFNNSWNKLFTSENFGESKNKNQVVWMVKPMTKSTILFCILLL